MNTIKYKTIKHKYIYFVFFLLVFASFYIGALTSENRDKNETNVFFEFVGCDINKKVKVNKNNAWEKEYKNKKTPKDFIAHINKNIVIHNLNSLKSIDKRNDDFIKSMKDKKVPSIEDLNKIGKTYNIPDRMLYAIMMKESQGNPLAVSNKNALGAFQFRYSTAKEFGLVTNEKDLRKNIWYSADAAARYVSWLFKYVSPNLDHTKEIDYKYALAAYNAGVGKVGTRKNKKIPNYSETIDYLEKIIGYTKGYRHIVQPGERLAKIAKKYNLSKKELSKLNKGLTDIGLKSHSFIIVERENSFIDYTVKVGDTIFDIAKKNKINMESIIKANNINPNLIKAGQRIVIPVDKVI